MRDPGFPTRVLRNRRWRDLTALGKVCPVMAMHKKSHWVILVGAATDTGAPAVLVLDPAMQTPENPGAIPVPRDEVMAARSGTLVLCKRWSRLLDENQPFGLRWFVPEIIRHRGYFRDVATTALASNLIALCTPLLFQVIIDQVLPHHNYQTLFAVALIFLVLTAFDGLFGYVRQQMMLFATNKIDASLAACTYQRLLGLPMPFFEHIAAGVFTRHMQQTEKLRHFLTGRLFQTLLDAAALPILITLLALYSGRLTLVVMVFALSIAGVIALLVPIFRRRLNLLYQAEGARQVHLVETIHGMRTIKSLAMEALHQNSWDGKVVAAICRYAGVGRIGALAAAMTSGLINEYQETAISVKMLATVMDHPPEQDQRHPGVRPIITGHVVFDQVTFRYAGATAAALDRASFEVRTGQVIGVVGRSGSGKTTITRLIHGIHWAQERAIRLGGIDIRHIDLSHLREAVGVVLQDSFLFRGSIRDNIAAAKPNAPMEDIVAAAQMAGTAEFIDRLPLSYETMLEEGASNLLGGQRQRIAIARALLPQPRLLIFDEATSALDPESEAILQTNLLDIAHTRTMIVVSHRLSSLVGSDAILVLDQGAVVDFASHTVLLKRCEIYRHLWQQQTKHVRR